MCAHSPEAQLHPGMHQEKRGQQDKRGDSATLLQPRVLCPALEPLAEERHGCVGVGPEDGHKNDQRAETPLL